MLYYYPVRRKVLPHMGLTKKLFTSLTTSGHVGFRKAVSVSGIRAFIALFVVAAVGISTLQVLKSYALTTSASAACTAAADTPGGPDPWGGCFPGQANVGVLSSTQLVNADTASMTPPNAALPSDNAGWYFYPAGNYIRVRSANAVIDGISDSDGVYVPAGDSLTVKNSQTGAINDQGVSLTVENSTVNGGNQTTSPTISGQNVIVLSSNLYGGKDEINCGGSNCTVENSWLHDNYPAPANGAHQQGFFADGGTSYNLQHNSIFCAGNCTADVSFIPNTNMSGVTINQNLLVASPSSSYCLYAGSDAPSKPGVINQVSVTNNVVQKGANGRCGQYGPVATFDTPNAAPGTNGYDNVWSGNTWDNGTVLNP